MRSKSGTRLGPIRGNHEDQLRELDDQSMRMPQTIKKFNQSYKYNKQYSSSKSAPRSDGPGRRGHYYKDYRMEKGVSPTSQQRERTKS